MTAPRTVIRSNGRAYRVALLQPPHFRTGQNAAPAIDTVALDAISALKRCDSERSSHYRSTGTRAITTK